MRLLSNGSPVCCAAFKMIKVKHIQSKFLHEFFLRLFCWNSCYLFLGTWILLVLCMLHPFLMHSTNFSDNGATRSKMSACDAFCPGNSKQRCGNSGGTAYMVYSAGMDLVLLLFCRLSCWDCKTFIKINHLQSLLSITTC